MPESGSQNPITLAIREALEAWTYQLMVCLPGTVQDFDPDTQLAQVRPDIQKLDSGEPFTLPVIINVPVLFPGDGKWFFFHQITPGETEGLLHFSQRALDTWIDQGGPVAPHELRAFSEEDAFFAPGVRSQPNAIPAFRNDGVGMGNAADDTYAHLKANGAIEVKAAGDVAVESGGAVDVQSAKDTTINGARITPQGDVVTAAGVSLNNHPHAQPSDSAGDSESPTNAPTPTE